MKIKNFKVSGVKNLNNTYMEFANKGLKSEEPLIKLIYGNMGSGKSAMIEAIAIYFSICDQVTIEGIDTKKEKDYLLSVMSSNTITFCVSFLRNGKDYYHEIDITNYDGVLLISRELILDGNKVIYEYVDNKVTVEDIFETPGGDISDFLTKSIFTFGHFMFNMENTFTNSDGSIDEVKTELYNKNKKKLKLKKEHIYGFNSTLSFIPTKYDGLINLKNLKNESHNIGYDGLFSSGSKGYYDETLDNQKFYSPSSVEEADIPNLLKFVQIFNKNIIDIELIKYDETEDEVNNDYEIVYANHRVPLSLESIGLKKIFKYYNLLLFANGSILIIDDFDVFLTEKTIVALQEFIVKYCNTQVIFSVNNVNLMQVVKNNKKSISFMDNGNVLNWRKNGNENPSNMYMANKIIDDSINAEEILNVMTENMYFNLNF